MQAEAKRTTASPAISATPAAFFYGSGLFLGSRPGRSSGFFCGSGSFLGSRTGGGF